MLLAMYDAQYVARLFMTEQEFTTEHCVFDTKKANASQSIESKEDAPLVRRAPHRKEQNIVDDDDRDEVIQAFGANE
jgi:hypothetical protein